ncbi:MAG: 4-hydroxy-tetrahydrodipicolinate synthase [Promethearchaeota archaeon]
MNHKFQGSMTALITPFDSNLEIDEVSLRSFVDYQIEKGSDALVPCGTTGESATMSHSEHQKIIEIVIDQANGRVPVIAGAGSNSTAEAISLTKHAKDVGANAVLSIVPYYNKPTHEGLIRHFRMIAEKVDIPIILYNIPSRTGQNMETKTIIKLSKIDNIVGIKEASGNINQITNVILGTRDNPNFQVISGDEDITVHVCALGGVGVIGVAANIIPNRMSRFIDACLKNGNDDANTLHLELYPFFKALFCETNPGPVKFMASKLKIAGISNWYIRPPLVMPTEKNQIQIQEVLQDLGIKSTN